MNLNKLAAFKVLQPDILFICLIMFIALICVCVYVCVCVCVEACASHSEHVEVRGLHEEPVFSVWIPRIRYKPSDVVATLPSEPRKWTKSGITVSKSNQYTLLSEYDADGTEKVIEC